MYYKIKHVFSMFWSIPDRTLSSHYWIQPGPQYLIQYVIMLSPIFSSHTFELHSTKHAVGTCRKQIFQCPKSLRCYLQQTRSLEHIIFLFCGQNLLMSLCPEFQPRQVIRFDHPSIKGIISCDVGMLTKQHFANIYSKNIDSSCFCVFFLFFVKNRWILLTEHHGGENYTPDLIISSYFLYQNFTRIMCPIS